jgi:hypothetical protein
MRGGSLELEAREDSAGCWRTCGGSCALVTAARACLGCSDEREGAAPACRVRDCQVLATYPATPQATMTGRET